jgi:hypothetical protein
MSGTQKPQEQCDDAHLDKNFSIACNRAPHYARILSEALSTKDLDAKRTAVKTKDRESDEQGFSQTQRELGDKELRRRSRRCRKDRDCCNSIIVVVEEPCDGSGDGTGKTYNDACVGPENCTPNPLLTIIEYVTDKKEPKTKQDACDIDTAGWNYVRCRKASGEGKALDVLAAEALLQYWRVEGFVWNGVVDILLQNLYNILLPLAVVC